MTSSEDQQELFCLFGSAFEDVQPDPEEKMREIAPQKEIESLMKQIGGFSMWPALMDDCKRIVARFLDYKTLTRLGMCSKSDNALVKKTMIHVDRIAIIDNEDENSVNVCVMFHKDFNSGQRIEMNFSQLEKDTQVRWMKYSPRKRPEARCQLTENSDYYEEAVKFAEKWMERCQFKLNGITVEMSKYPLERSKIVSLPNCTKIRIGIDDLSTLKWWFEKVPEELEDLQLVTLHEDRLNFTLPSDLLSTPHIMNVQNFYFWCRAAFSDEQFLTLKAKEIIFDAVDVTDDGINEFLKKWVSGKAVDGFKKMLLWSDRVPDMPRVTRGLQLRPWDDIFEQEARGFCGDFERVCGRGECFQISSRVQPFESLTLCFSSDRISIYATGKKYTWNGKTYTNYSIPS